MMLLNTTAPSLVGSADTPTTAMLFGLKKDSSDMVFVCLVEKVKAYTLCGGLYHSPCLFASIFG
jgi:hypothetical protein